MSSPTTNQDTFTEEQKQYLQGFAAGSGLLRSLVLPADASGSDPNRAAQAKALAEGKKLAAEEDAKKRIGHGLDIWGGNPG